MSRTHPCLLVLDASSETFGVGVACRGTLVENSGPGGSASSQHLIPAIDDALARAGCRRDELDAVGFCAGPGSFTGVRTAAAIAQGIARGCNIPIIAIGSLDVLAGEALRLSTATMVAAVIDARMGEVYYAVYRRGKEGALAVVREPAVAAPTVALGDIALVIGQEQVMIAGQPGLLTGLAKAQTLELRIEPAAMLRHASSLWAAGRCVDPTDAQPIYVRNKVALTTAERDARNAGKEAR